MLIYFPVVQDTSYSDQVGPILLAQRFYRRPLLFVEKNICVIIKVFFTSDITLFH